MALTVIEGTWEEIERRKDELIGHRLFVTFEPDENKQETDNTKARRLLSGFGAFKGLTDGSEAFAQEKQKAIEREDQSL